MDDAFSQALTDWTAFYALMGGAAATLLGLLFVAVSVRLNIFHQRRGGRCPRLRGVHVRHVPGRHRCRRARDCPARPPILPRVVVAAGLHCGLRRDRLDRSPLDSLERPSDWCTTGLPPGRMAGLGVSSGDERTVRGLIAVVVLLWRSHPAALGWLAVVEGWLLVMGTVAAWVMLSHAGGPPVPGDTSDTPAGRSAAYFGGPAPPRPRYPSSRSGLSSLKKLLWLPSVVVS